MTSKDRLVGLTEFLTSAEEGSFAAASEKLHLTRSAVSKKVSRLEARLGTTLFHRTGRVLQLTEAGRAFHRRCRRALEEVEAGEAEIEHERHDLAGRIRISAPVLYGRLRVAPVLMHLARTHPQLALQFSLSDDVVDLPRDGYDIAIRLAKPRHRPELKMRRLDGYTMHACASPAYLAEHGSPSTPDDLLKHSCITYSRANGIPRWFFAQAGGARVKISPPRQYVIDNLETIADFARGGLGVAWLPDWMISGDLAEKRLLSVMPEQANLRCEVHVAWMNSMQTTRRLRLLIDTLFLSIRVGV